jgi:regulator of replication initiation timing
MAKKSTKKRVYNKSTGRDYSYDKEYNKKTVKQRVSRNKARAMMLEKLKKRLGSKTEAKAMMRGKDVDHKRPIRSGGTSSSKNIRLRSVALNRGRRQ